MRILIALFIAAISITGLALAPQSITVTNLRDEAVGYASGLEFYRGQSLVFTNCLAYSGGTTASARENLDGVGVTITVGWPYSNISWNATTQATNGVYDCIITVPTNWIEPFIQFKLTNSANTFIYPLKILKTRDALE